MKLSKFLLLILFVYFLAACSSKTILKTPETSLRAIGDTVQVNIAGQNIQQKVLDQLKREIKGQLIIAGFDIADKVNLKTSPQFI